MLPSRFLRVFGAAAVALTLVLSGCGGTAAGAAQTRVVLSGFLTATPASAWPEEQSSSCTTWSRS